MTSYEYSSNYWPGTKILNTLLSNRAGEKPLVDRSSAAQESDEPGPHSHSIESRSLETNGGSGKRRYPSNSGALQALGITRHRLETDNANGWVQRVLPARDATLKLTAAAVFVF